MVHTNSQKEYLNIRLVAITDCLNTKITVHLSPAHYTHCIAVHTDIA